jgi:putative polyketide hydroxylase
VIDPGAEWRENLPAAPLREQRTGGPDLAEVSPCEGAAISQDVFEEVLRAEAAVRPGAELRFGTELVSFVAGPGGVEAELSGSVTVRARYLIAADGVRSGIRQRLGIALRGDDDLGRMRAVARSAPTWTRGQGRCRAGSTS